MRTVFPFLAGILMGICVTWWLQSRAHRHALESYYGEGHYEPIRRAVARHLHVRGILTLAQLMRMTDLGDETAKQYLDRMVDEGFIRQQSHRGADAFYTLK